MKIATMVRGYIPAPRPVDMVYAPIDLAVAISENLHARGHEVTYFGPNGTRINAKVETGNLRPLVHNQQEFQELVEKPDMLMHYVPGLWDNRLVQEMFERARAGEYDLLHFHHPESAFPYAKNYPDVPVVYTLHDPLTDWYRELLEMYQTPNQFYISISDNQRTAAPDLPFVATVYNGIDTELFATSDEHHEDYLMFAGRVVQEKGVKEAVQVAQLTDHRLFIIGPVYNDKRDYFDQHIKPHLNDKILYLGFLEWDQLTSYLQKAKALLAPIQWEEPFGLTMVEAMSCGTPVIAMNRGAVSEVIKDGKTGYIVNSVAEMVNAVKKVGAINHDDCRAHVEKHFSHKKMVDGYEAAFELVLKTFKNSGSTNGSPPVRAAKKTELKQRPPTSKPKTRIKARPKAKAKVKPKAKVSARGRSLESIVKKSAAYLRSF